MRTVVIAGGSGFLGKVLSNYFQDKVEKIVILSRSEEKTVDNIHYLQ